VNPDKTSYTPAMYRAMHYDIEFPKGTSKLKGLPHLLFPFIIWHLEIGDPLKNEARLHEIYYDLLAHGVEIEQHQGRSLFKSRPGYKPPFTEELHKLPEDKLIRFLIRTLKMEELAGKKRMSRRTLKRFKAELLANYGIKIPGEEYSK
jgi:hypothetical protein